MMKKNTVFPLAATQRFVIALICLGALAAAGLLLSRDSPPHAPAGRPAASESAASLQQTALPGAAVPPQPGDAMPRAAAPTKLSEHVSEYHISVRYDDQQRMLYGEQTVTWSNPGTASVSELYFHMYPNAFSSPDTTFMKESGGRLRDTTMKEGSFASMTMLSIQSMDGEEWLHRMQFVQPDDGNTADRSLMRLRLPAAVHGGDAITLKMKFEVKLPFPFARMGATDDYVLAGQWFPKLAVYEPAGRRGRTDEGWHMHQYHGNSEFYADFGSYNVKISVPEGYTVAASGFPVKPPVPSAAGSTYHYYAEDVHDFAWSASTRFVHAEESFSDRYVPGVKIKLYVDNAHEHLMDRYMLVAKQALSRYSEWFGPYPYSTLSVVVPPADAGGTAGMEYPTLVTAWEASVEIPGDELERVVAHEIAHQYWYGIVASNEMEEAWLDEAFASYAEHRFMELEYDAKANLPLEAVHIAEPASLRQPSWAYSSHAHYAENVYLRGKLVLLAIEREIGEAAMRKVMRAYYDRWKFRHPATADFQRTLEDVTKRSWAVFFDQFVYDSKMLDYEVQAIEVKPDPDGKPGEAYDNLVKIVRHGGYHTPVPVLFYFADGSTVSKTWEGAEQSIVYQIPSASPLVWAAVDYKHSLVLENRHYNNILRADIDQTWKVRWSVLIGKTLETAIGFIFG